MARVCHSLVQRHTPSSLAAVIGLSNNDMISLRFLRSIRSLHCMRCVVCKIVACCVHDLNNNISRLLLTF